MPPGCCPVVFFYADAAVHQPVDLRPTEGHPLFLEIFHDVAVGGFGREGAERSRLEYVPLAEQLLGVLMYPSLHLAREVQVDIRGFFSVEAEEGLKGNVVPVGKQPLAADRAVLLRQIKAGALLPYDRIR